MKQIIKRNLRKFGFDIINLKGHWGSKDGLNELKKILASVNVDLVLDIGAGRGQFASSLISIGYKGNVLSFEPLSSLYKELLSNSDKTLSWYVYDQVAVGDHEGQIKINISNLISNSSILNMNDNDFVVKNSQYVAQETVNLISLDSLNTNKLIQNSKNVFIKMDIQGLEHVVLRRLGDIKFDVVGFYLELSLVKLYEGQEDYLYICNYLKNHGYDLVYVVPESIRKERMIQFNGVFLHESVSYNLNKN